MRGGDSEGYFKTISRAADRAVLAGSIPSRAVAEEHSFRTNSHRPDRALPSSKYGNPSGPHDSSILSLATDAGGWGAGVRTKGPAGESHGSAAGLDGSWPLLLQRSQDGSPG